MGWNHQLEKLEMIWMTQKSLIFADNRHLWSASHFRTKIPGIYPHLDGDMCKTTWLVKYC